MKGKRQGALPVRVCVWVSREHLDPGALHLLAAHCSRGPTGTPTVCDMIISRSQTCSCAPLSAAVISNTVICLPFPQSVLCWRFPGDTSECLNFVLVASRQD